MRMRRSITCLLLALLVLPVASLATAATTTEAPATTPPDPAPVEEATEDARQMRRELQALARAWDEGGGRFGYPFWEKAGQRWEDQQLTTSMYREYVTGYRDRLRAGCDLLDAADVSTAVARDVRELALDACRARVDALRDQQRWLDDLVERDTAGLDPETDREELDARIEERETAWRSRLQESLRDARLATDMTQGELDEAGLERISESAFL